MKHSSVDFTAHMLGLLKNSGTTGNSGNGPNKCLETNEKVGTTRDPSLVPLDSDWYQVTLASGTANCKEFQPLRKPVTSGTDGTAIFAEGDEQSKRGGTPPERYAILADLKTQNSVEWLSSQRWSGPS